MGWFVGWEKFSSALQSMLTLLLSSLEKVVRKPRWSISEPGTQAHFLGAHSFGVVL